MYGRISSFKVKINYTEVIQNILLTKHTHTKRDYETDMYRQTN